MLDNETKRRIETARDILVGKLPDPKSQVEQITIALIYKFMDDMDAESVSFGGEPSFFVGDYEKYGWRKLLDANLGGFETLALYGEAMTKLHENENLPQLFRDIFKNAYLPYRDPETLKLFLKTINGFVYDHSERLGDAFEYLLSVLGSQGDAGQFRTPRHVIDFIVKVLDPKKTETISDPACGTAGFLISAYKHILQMNPNLTPSERKSLMTNFAGYDISPDMVRLSLVNMYLHGFPSPHIYEYDSLTSEDRWSETFDIVMANPPFMSPKGGIKPHKKFSINANRSEVLFVDYIAEHIHPTHGRAGIIVPEGIIFQSAGAYKDLRKMLVDKAFLYAVVSLPAGVFQPYSGVKTSVLLMDKTIAAKTDKILFVKIQNDGFGLGAQRRELATSDLPDALNLIRDFEAAVLQGDVSRFEGEDLPLQAVAVEKTQIAATGDYNLSGDKYITNQVNRYGKWDLVDFEDLVKNVKYTNKIQRSEFLESGKFPIVDQSEKFIAGYWNNEADVFKLEKPIIAFGDHTRIFKYVDFDFVLGADGIKILQPNSKIDSKFFYNVLQNIEIKSLGYSRHYKELKETKIPLPPLSIQKEIVEKIEGFQRIIDGAKQVVENYKPQIDISPDWEMVELGEVCEAESGAGFPLDFQGKTDEKFPFYKVSDMNLAGNEIFMITHNNSISQTVAQQLRAKICPADTVIFPKIGAAVATNKKRILTKDSVFDNNVMGLVVKTPEKLNSKYLFYHLLNFNLSEWASDSALPSIRKTTVEEYKIPLPPLEVQQEIVARIEREQQLINSNKELITIFEAKIKDEINKLWEN